jgi:hypothetical protein
MKNDTMEFTMKEVFLALQPQDGERIMGGDNGLCNSRWISDSGLISQYIKAGWYVYRVNGFKRITDVNVELKMEKKDGCDQSDEPTKSDNKRGR